jgi:hypothetical protein
MRPGRFACEAEIKDTDGSRENSAATLDGELTSALMHWSWSKRPAANIGPRLRT